MMTSGEVERDEERRRTAGRGYLRRAGQAVEPAEFQDVSENGFCVRQELPIGEILVATVPSLGTIEAQVRWSIGGRSGLKILTKRAPDGS